MKNHIKVDGKLLQTNKKWSHLKNKQKDWIANRLRADYLKVLKEKGRKPNKSENEDILSKVLFEIEEKGIWIPDFEVKRYFDGKKGKWANKYFKLRGD